MDRTREWLEPDGLGGFASGTVGGERTRRYHALLLTATTPPTGRQVLVNGLDAWLESPAGRIDLTVQRYLPGITVPAAAVERRVSFASLPWPAWTHHLDDGATVRHELFVPHGAAGIALSWAASGLGPGTVLAVRPFLSGRDYHSLQHANDAFAFAPVEAGGTLAWRPYAGGPGFVASTSGKCRRGTAAGSRRPT